MKEGISLCMIVKNESSTLKRALSSFRGIASEVIVGDTGSTDDSQSICRQWNARIHEIPWQEDFSLARNRVLEKASCRWIFVLDGDEFLKEGYGQNLLDESRREGVCGYFVPFEDLQDNGYPQTYALPRFFLNDPSIRFKNPIHETVMESLERFSRKIGTTIDTSQSAIVHTGYQSSEIDKKGKLKRNLLLLQKLYERGEADPFLLLKYGDNLRLLHRKEEALSVFFQALDLLDSSPQKGGIERSGLINEIIFGASTLLIDKGHLDEALALCRKGEKVLPSLTLSYNQGLILWKEGRLEEALSLFQEVERGKEQGLLDPSGALPLALNAMGEIYFQLKMLPEAEASYLKSLRLAPRFLNPWFNLCRLSLEKEDLEKAKEYIEKAYAIDNSNETIVKTRKLLFNAP